MDSKSKVDNLYDVERCQLIAAIRQRMFDTKENEVFQCYVHYEEIYKHVPMSKYAEILNEQVRMHEVSSFGHVWNATESKILEKSRENKLARFEKYCELMGWRLVKFDSKRINLIAFHPVNKPTI